VSVEYSNIGEGDKAIALHFFDNRCCYCSRELTRKYGFPNSLEMEHYISVDSQAQDSDLVIDGSISNRVPSCRTCNRQKSNINPETWIRSKFKNAEEIIEKIEMYLSMQQEFLF
jgi:thioredoxin-related protein